MMCGREPVVPLPVDSLDGEAPPNDPLPVWGPHVTPRSVGLPSYASFVVVPCLFHAPVYRIEVRQPVGGYCRLAQRGESDQVINQGIPCRQTSAARSSLGGEIEPSAWLGLKSNLVF
jgi:hypothetical protein